MNSNLDHLSEGLNALILEGKTLECVLTKKAFPAQAKTLVARLKKLKAESWTFSGAYHPWYAEARAVVKQLLPDHVVEFENHFEIPKNRKRITVVTYKIKDVLLGVTASSPQKEYDVGFQHAIPGLQQQVVILKSVRRRLESVLFDIERIVAADLFDSEIESARELLKNKFYRAAGMIAGVVLEKHLAQVCIDHAVVLKKNPTIAISNDGLRKADVIEVSRWRFIQHLGDIRNNCGHGRSKEPTNEDVLDIIDGVDKVIKTVH